MDSSGWAAVQGITGIGCFFVATLQWLGITPAMFRRGVGRDMPVTERRNPVWTAAILSFSLVLFAGSSYQCLHLAYPRVAWVVAGGFVVLCALLWIAIFSGKSVRERLRESAGRNLQYRAQLETIDQTHKDELRHLAEQMEFFDSSPGGNFATRQRPTWPPKGLSFS
jgi:hypothetical protein